MRVLLVDDDPDMRALVARAVGQEFPHAELLQVGEPTALPALLAEPVEILVSDYMLRWSDGFAVLDRVKQASPDCCCVMFTGTGNEELAVRAMKAGFDDYVVKSHQQLRRLAAAVRLAYERREERRRLEEHRTLLLRELYHRVHNNLQIVISLVRRTAKGIGDPADRQRLADLQQRIQAVSMLQEEFYRIDRIDAVPFHDYLSRLAEQQRGLAPSLRLETWLEPIMVSVPQAVPLALIANELLANAIRHGFPQGRPGTVRIELSRDQDRIVLRVSDNGVGASQGDDNSANLGLELMQGLARQLDAEMRSEEPAGGGWSTQVVFQP